MSVSGNSPVTSNLVDTIGRFVANVGVPAAMAFFILYQITPRLDTTNSQLAQLQTSMAVNTASCTRTVVGPNP